MLYYGSTKPINPTSTKMQQNLIIDGHNFVFRAYFVSLSINQAVESTIEMMIRSLIKQFSPKKIFVAWDSKINSTARNFRHELSGHSYKKNRDSEPEALQYISVAKDILENKFKVRSVHPSNLEGDDVVRWLSLQFSPSIIVSTDRDFIQLINEFTSLWIPTKKVLVTSENVTQFTDGIVSLTDWLIYKSIIGDKSDNIEGVKGFGPVKAKALMTLFKVGSSQSVYTDRINRNLQIFDLAYAEKAEPNEYEKYKQQLADLFESSPF